MVAGQGPGVGAGRSLGSGAAARMHEHDRLARPPGRRSGFQEHGRLADRLDEQGEDVGVGAPDQVGEKVFDPERRLVAGGGGEGDVQPACGERLAHVAGHGAALGEHHRARSAVAHDREDRLEGQGARRAVGDRAKAVGAEQRQARVRRRSGQGVLGEAAGLARLREAGGEHDRPANPAPPAGLDRGEYGGLRHDQDDRVHALGQLVDRLQAGPAADLVAAAADQVDIAGEGEPLQVGQDRAAGRGGLGGGAHHRHRPRVQQALERGAGHGPGQRSRRYACSPGRKDFSSRNCFMPAVRPSSGSSILTWSDLAIR